MKQSEENMLTGMKMFCTPGTKEMCNVRNMDYKTVSTVTLQARGGWQIFLWLWGAMGSPAYREDCDNGGGAEDEELIGVIRVLK